MKEDKEIEISSYYSESDEVIARKLQNIELLDKVTFIQAKHIPTTTISDKDVLSNSDSDTDDTYNFDIAGPWEDGGSWEKFDLSGMPIIPIESWKRRQHLKKLKNIENKYLMIRKKRNNMLLDLLSNKSEYEVYKKRFSNYSTPKFFIEPSFSMKRELWLNKHEEKTAYELFENVDKYTVNIIDHILKNGFIENVDKIITIDHKNSIIFHTTSNKKWPNKSRESIEELILKIFKRNFFNGYNQHYMSFAKWKPPEITHLSRSLLNVMAAKESSILRKLKSVGVRCPKVITLPESIQRHIVVMSFLGKNKKPAPKLTNIQLEDEGDWLLVYEEIKQAIRIMYKEAHIVHNDLLHHTLWHNNHCYFVDFSQAFDTNDKDTRNELFKNCEKITEFFSTKVKEGILTPMQLFYATLTRRSKQKKKKTHI